MKMSVAGVTLLLAFPPLALADDKPTIESECRAIAESHGVAAEKLDDWMKRCVDRTKEMQHKMDEGGKPHDGMSHEGMNGMHKNPESGGK